MLIVGCAGVPKVTDPSGVDINVVSLTEREVLGRFGMTTDGNPYVAPGAAVMGTPGEYIVLRFDISASHEGIFHLNRIDALGPDSKPVATAFERDGFASYAPKWTDDESLAKKLSVNVERTYLPGYDFPIRPGRRTYYAVLAGKRPLPRPFVVTVSVSIDSGTARDFAFQVNP